MREKRTKEMSRRKGSVKTYTNVNVFNLFAHEVGIFPLYQRGYSWEIDNVEPFVTTLMRQGALSDEERNKYEDHLGTFILYRDDTSNLIVADYNEERSTITAGISAIIDGQSRLMTMNLFIMAINDYIRNNNLRIKTLPQFSLSYDEESVNNEFATFCLDRTKGARFAKIYKYMYDEIKKHNKKLNGIIDYLTNNIIAHLEVCNDASVGYDLFEKVNTTGKPLDGKEFIHSTLKQYSNKYGVPMDYDCDDIVSFTRSYYGVRRPYSKKKFTNSIIKDFMNADIVNSREDLIEFTDYLANIKEFETSTIGQAIIKLDRDRVRNFACALIATGHDVDGSDKYVNNLLLGLLNFSIIATYKGINPSGETGEMIDNIIQMVGLGKTPKDIFAFVKEWMTITFKNNNVHNDEFFYGIDQLGDKKHIAIMLADLWIHNHSSKYVNLWLEHSYPKAADEVYEADGWIFDDENDKLSLINNIGNKFLMNYALNRKSENQYLDAKDVYYKKCFQSDKGLATSLNKFDALKYKAQRIEYANERKLHYIQFLQNLPFGDIMFKA